MINPKNDPSTSYLCVHTLPVLYVWGNKDHGHTHMEFPPCIVPDYCPRSSTAYCSVKTCKRTILRMKRSSFGHTDECALCAEYVLSKRTLLFGGHQRDDHPQGGAGWDDVLVTFGPESQFRRYLQAPLSADTHAHNAFIPSLDHLINSDRKFQWL